MNFSDLKYFAAYTIPLCTLIGLTQFGYFTYLTLFYAFGFLPLSELVLKGNTNNLSKDIVDAKRHAKFFDWLLYFNLVWVYGLVFLFLWVLRTYNLSSFEIIGLISGLGISLSTNGINVGHELGHRSEKHNQWIGKILYLPSMYMHFFIEHNLGHHKNVATNKDPASAKKNEIIYFFWLRSLAGGFIGAWRIESKRLSTLHLPSFSYRNNIIQYMVMQFVFLFLIYNYAGLIGLKYYLIVALVSVLLLESINYIEHYGLRRQKMDNGRYERVKPVHSWNSNHDLGRIVLYELTRHSDHHFIANKEYQLLDHHDEARQLPLGYPGSILLALLPPMWFKVMNPRI